ncbi:DUF881 domain-containing protein [Yinghuangia seranimata]|uniref:DUF881 domain-containing protein n=1 Tax=Yinghuangia seranimata TaxID=408067 RepID=UPI00248B7C94|nr:DUF881 domain-containing protein [Yinghuangia seranimata]MDI2132857.1 DUF881 domain-containing protein [Yinghuangia seranimata]
MVFGLAGLLFWISANTSHGVNLRNDSQSMEYRDLVRKQGQQNAVLDRDLGGLREDVDDLTRGQVTDPEAQARVDALQGPSGLSPLSGPGLTVTLMDAPPDATAKIPGVRQPTADDLVVHQQDIQGVVNALWAGGAQGVQIMDQRLVATSAVRCVGNTLILHGRVYSPPYVISAVGDVDKLRRALDDSESVYNYTTYVTAYGLGYKVEDRKQLNLPGYTGPLDLQYAKVS